MAVGCPALSDGRVDCQRFMAFTIGADGGDTNPLILFADRGPDGSLHVVGGRRVLNDAPAVRGGELTLGQRSLPYQGPLWFTPVSLKSLPHER